MSFWLYELNHYGERQDPQGSCAGVQIYTIGTDNIDTGLSLPPVLVHQEISGQDPDWSFAHRSPRVLASTSSSGSNTTGIAPHHTSPACLLLRLLLCFMDYSSGKLEILSITSP